MALVKRVTVQADIQCTKCKEILHSGEVAIKDRSAKYEITPAVKIDKRVAHPGCNDTIVSEVLEPKKVVRHPERPTLYYCETCYAKHKAGRRVVARRKHAQVAIG